MTTEVHAGSRMLAVFALLRRFLSILVVSYLIGGVVTGFLLLDSVARPYNQYTGRKMWVPEDFQMWWLTIAVVGGVLAVPLILLGLVFSSWYRMPNRAQGPVCACSPVRRVWRILTGWHTCRPGSRAARTDTSQLAR